MFRTVRVFITAVLVLFMHTPVYAMTIEEAEQKYRELQCHRVDDMNFACETVKCNVVDEIVKMSVVEWDIPLPDPTPIPEPIPTPPPACVAAWCSAPLIKCTDTPIKGIDSCGNECTKPSSTWPNCLLPDGSVGQIQ